MISPKSSGVRPTSDKVRSAIFSKIYDKIDNANVLDLFAGTGAFGIEAISRGANFVTFIDKDVSTLIKNVKLLEKNNYEIIKRDIFQGLKKVNKKYDIVFIDPPYGKINSKDIMQCLKEYQTIAKDGVLIYEESIRTEFQIDEGFKLIDSKRYGDTIIYYLELE
ncbi:16S rRNA (guanine(966)-N(2))-methyltransferase RsmD [Deferribacter thermophilus]|uniref:16S rRNA (guanine(966)-N(2))-methyltransferase RsmD n=1 Tax=Deferribacter thermophilus TaxID=53573 RepID=UPI003C25D044